MDLEASGKETATGGGGEIRYRFVDSETEAQALEEERAAAAEEEAKVGKVIFASDS